MNLQSLNDRELLNRTHSLVQNERHTLTQFLHHLREVDRRNLFSDLGYSSLFDYAVRELKYSEGQAGRRIQAMRLLKEIPELEKKIQSGALSLTSISQAQSYFREANKSQQKILEKSQALFSQPTSGIEHKQTPIGTGVGDINKSPSEVNPLKTSDIEDHAQAGPRSLQLNDKIKILSQLENKSSRETERLLLSLNPNASLPKEKQRAVSETHTEVRFVMDHELFEKLETVKSLLGASSLNMNMAELINKMASITEEALRIKKFGKRSHNNQLKPATQPTETFKETPAFATNLPERLEDFRAHATASAETVNSKKDSAAELPKVSKRASTFSRNLSQHLATPAPELNPSTVQSSLKLPHQKRHSRSISKGLKFRIWQRDRGQCQGCGGRYNLQIDHIQPFSLGGDTDFANLRLLCFYCNQRRAVKSFGLKNFV